MSWQPIGKTMSRCTRHNTEFRTGVEVCSACTVDPGPPPDFTDEIKLPDPPAGCATSDEHERCLTSLAVEAERLAELASEGETGLSNATKLLDVAIKARRAAGEYTKDRERKAYVRELQKSERDRHGSGGN